MARMGAIESSCVFDLDATISASYSGSGTTWANYEDSPADGSGQTAYDFRQGDGSTSSTYPTFNGSAGSAAAYWSFDGGDRFDLLNGMTAFLQNLHKTTGGQANTIAVAGQLTAGTTFQTLFATGTTTSIHGVQTRWNNSEGADGVQGGSAQVVGSFEEVNFQTGFNFLMVMAYDPSTSTFKCWLNGVRQADKTITPSTSTTNSTNCRIGSNTSTTPGNLINSGGRIYAVSAYNAVLDNTKEAAIRAEYETRHARSYTRSQTLLSAATGLSVVAEWNAGLYASVYGGGSFNNDFKNAETAPADGSAQSAYDLVDVSSPPFVNFAASGVLPFFNPAAADYWEAAANTTWSNSLHRTDAANDAWWVILIVTIDGTFDGNIGLFKTALATGAGTGDGIILYTTTAEGLLLRQVNAASTVEATLKAAGSLTSGTHIIGVTHSLTNNNCRVWQNSTTSSSVGLTYAANTTNSSNPIGVNTFQAATGDEDEFDYTVVACGIGYLTDADFAAALYHYEEQFNKDLNGDAVIGSPATFASPAFNPYYSRFVGQVGW